MNSQLEEVIQENVTIEGLIELEPESANAVIDLGVTAQFLAEMAVEAGKQKFDTTEQYNIGVKKISQCVTLRVKVKASQLKITKPMRDEISTVNDAGKALIASLIVIEKTLKDKRAPIDAAKLQQKEAKAKIVAEQQKKLDALRSAPFTCGVTVQGIEAVLLNVNNTLFDESWDAQKEYAEQTKSGAIKRLESALAQAKELAKQKADIAQREFELLTAQKLETEKIDKAAKNQTRIGRIKSRIADIKNLPIDGITAISTVADLTKKETILLAYSGRCEFDEFADEAKAVIVATQTILSRLIAARQILDEREVSLKARQEIIAAMERKVKIDAIKINFLQSVIEECSDLDITELERSIVRFKSEQSNLHTEDQAIFSQLYRLAIATSEAELIKKQESAKNIAKEKKAKLDALNIEYLKSAAKECSEQDVAELEESIACFKSDQSNLPEEDGAIFNQHYTLIINSLEAELSLKQEAAKADQAVKDKKAAERLEALKPDKDKLDAWLTSIHSAAKIAPDMTITDKELAQFQKDASMNLIAAIEIERTVLLDEF